MKVSRLSEGLNEFRKEFADAYAKTTTASPDRLKELHPRKAAYPHKTYPLGYIKDAETAEELEQWWREVAKHYKISLSDIGEFMVKLYSYAVYYALGAVSFAAPSQLYIAIGGDYLYRAIAPDQHPKAYTPYVFDCLMKGGRHLQRARALHLTSPQILIAGIQDDDIWRHTKSFGTGISIPNKLSNWFSIACDKQPATVSIECRNEKGLPIVKALLELLRTVATVAFDPEASKKNPRRVVFTLK